MNMCNKKKLNNKFTMIVKWYLLFPYVRNWEWIKIYTRREIQ